MPAIADDSGIEVDALGGKPGPRSARYAGEDATDEQNLEAMMQAMRGIPSGGRTARYRCIAAIAWPGRTRAAHRGTCEGTLVNKRHGERGFGYDPIFVPEGWDETMASSPTSRRTASATAAGHSERCASSWTRLRYLTQGRNRRGRR